MTENKDQTNLTNQKENEPLIKKELESESIETKKTSNIQLNQVDLDNFKGPRYSKLCMVFDKALSKSIDTFSLNKLKKSFPQLAEHDEKGLSSAHNQVTQFLNNESKLEFDKIIKNRQIIRKLNELDFPENGKSIKLDKLMNTEPNELLINVCYQEKKRVLDQTKKELEELRKLNASKLAKLSQLNQETLKISTKIQSIGQDFNEAFELANDTKDVIQKS